jgi:glycosyltransferase involved in cell wall biosynthesis
MRLQARIQNDPEILKAASDMEHTERAIWRDVDVVVYPSQEEAKTVKEMEPSVTACAVTPYRFTEFGERRHPPGGKNVLFVAGFGHPPNQDAALWFVSEILPLILRREKAVQVQIVGSNPSAQVRALASANVSVAANVSEAQLRLYHRTARVAVVPLRFGAGIKLKVVDALRHGVPLVTTPVGAQGLPGLEHVARVELDPGLFADAVCELLADDVAWKNACAEQIAYARERFSPQVLASELLKALNSRAFYKAGVSPPNER